METHDGVGNKRVLKLQAHVRIWNSVSLHTLHVIGLGDFERSICCLSFSKAVSNI